MNVRQERPGNKQNYVKGNRRLTNKRNKCLVVFFPQGNRNCTKHKSRDTVLWTIGDARELLGFKL